MWVRGLKLGFCAVRFTAVLSHPMWVRGLKHLISKEWLHTKVAPYVGAWIETYLRVDSIFEGYVAPYVGAWIETKRS